MRREDEHDMRQTYLQLFLAMFYTLLFLVVIGLCGCSGGGNSSSNSPAAKVIASIAITPVNNRLAVGKTLQFKADGTNTDGTPQDLTTLVTWSSSDMSKATIDSGGKATAVAPGPITITATLAGVSATALLTVPATTLVSMAITPPNPKIAINTTQQLTATGAYSDGTFQDLTSAVTWKSSDESKATIAPGGKATALAAGSTTITAASDNGKVSATTTMNVTSASFQSIVITSSNPVIAAGTTLQFSATGTFPDNTTQDLTNQVAWSSSASSIATIDSSGKATAHAPGSTTITAALGSTTITATLTVTSATINSIAITSSNPVIAAGTTLQFSATGTLSDSTTQDLTNQVTWSSSAGSIATIGQNGKATAVAEGTTTITATLGSVTISQSLEVTPAIVSGKWEGTYTIYDAVDPSQIGTYTFKLDLTQSGTSVAGTSSLRYGTIGQLSADGRFTEGTVNGRRIEFTFTYLDPKHSWELVNVGTASITDTTMTGDVLENYNGGYNCSYIFSLKKL